MNHEKIQKLIKLCPDCGGEGKKFEDWEGEYNDISGKMVNCPTCKDGKIIEDERIDIDVPEGWKISSILTNAIMSEVLITRGWGMTIQRKTIRLSYLQGQTETHVCECKKQTGGIGSGAKLYKDGLGCFRCKGKYTIKDKITKVEVEEKEGKYQFVIGRDWA